MNLSEDKVREAADGTSFNPGAGGWPTIRYFNKETGIAGAPYTKKTEKAMCDELKQAEYMHAYVEEAAGTSLCNVETAAGCNEQQTDYIAKWKAKSPAERASQLVRLNKLLEDNPTKMKAEARSWLNKRKAILKQLGTAETGEL